MGYVYLLFCVGIDGSEGYKIGITKNDPNKRVKQLQTGNDSKIQLLKQYQSENYLKVEKWLHRRYNSFKTESNNEWFALQPEHVISFIKDCEEADNNISFLLNNNPFYN